ncbi:hypothetical protein BY996DRAFT_7644413 [Phakopsora pachyrhizi]|uniref:Expressed protein n=1 Tax=Phakopsora pachyrhizi TaxID=170000 RepID=A0A0S1MK85_PHAPC|nr:hypothetical protein BY996DRAFT_7868364 [Phakopsora pachyrhizi]KAI8447940.1 hypothetical protein BY996DRAFT_7644413 [Phakopsora pachyrhizi]CAH7678729.1 expressed protein [Phakopsora pachyrhizi]CAH7680889.1 expressed protein [Phakopsora pachyrhizi]
MNRSALVLILSIFIGIFVVEASPNVARPRAPFLNFYGFLKKPDPRGHPLHRSYTTTEIAPKSAGISSAIINHKAYAYGLGNAYGYEYGTRYPKKNP